MIAQFRIAGRRLLKAPAFTVTIVLTLALGLGITVAMFSVVEGVLIRSLSFRQPDRLYYIGEWIEGSGFDAFPVNASHFAAWRDQARSFSQIALLSPGKATLAGQGEPEAIKSLSVSSNFFDALGVHPVLGRGFALGEDTDGKANVVVLSDRLWRDRYHADPAVLGTSISIDGWPFTIVGVMPAGFHFPSAQSLFSFFPAGKPDLFTPKVLSSDELKNAMGNFNYGVIGRLKDGVSSQNAQSELTAIASEIFRHAGQKANLRAIVTPLDEIVIGKTRTGLVVLMAATASVLLIICVNLANLLLSRAEDNAADASIRLALGASRAQLLAQSIAEIVLLAGAGGLLSFIVSSATLRVLLSLAPVQIPRLDEVRLDGGVVAFAIGTALLTALIFGIGPSWHYASSDPQHSLRMRARTVAGRASRFSSALVAAEAFLTASLLVLAGLLLSSFSKIVRVDKGFSAPAVLALDIRIPSGKYQKPEEQIGYFERLTERLSAIPGVSSAAFVSALPLKGETWIDKVWPAGDQRAFWERASANVRFVSPSYFQALGIPLRAGRAFAGSDRGRKTAIISERLATELWPGQNAVGKHLDNSLGSYEVVGLVGDVRSSPDRPAAPIFYQPFWDWALNEGTVVVRGGNDSRSTASLVRSAVHSVDPEVPIERLYTMKDTLNDALAIRRFQMFLAGIFATASLIAAAVGIYGVVSYSVSRRRKEMGIRSALGALPANLIVMVLRQGMAPVVIGLAAGLATALAAGRVLQGLLFEITPFDPTTLAGVAAVLLLVGIAACFIPALRATRVDPTEALRSE